MKEVKAIVFGARGQDGYYLDQLLSQQGIKVIGVSRSGNHLQGNVVDKDFVDSLIKQHMPDYIFHLAANSTTNHGALFENHATISTGSLIILEAIRNYSPGSKVFLSGSGLQFLNKGEAINEETPFAPNNAYAVERIYTTYAARYYRQLGIKVYVGYFFNHDSPLRTSRHVSKMITEAVSRIKLGSNEMIEIGDLHTRKEWGFAGDIVQAVWTLVQQENIFEAVLGTGDAYSIQEWIEQCFEQVGLPWQPYVRQKENFKAEFKILVSNPALIRSLGWQPATSFAQLATLMLNQ